MYKLALSMHSIDTLDYHRQLLTLNAGDIGAITTFTGLARSFTPSVEVATPTDPEVSSILIEHYPQMTESVIEKIAQTAVQDFHLKSLWIVHRVGLVQVKEVIVWIGAAAVHRRDSFLACEFMIDYLKNQAPFWKKEFTASGSRWVMPKISDADDLAKWRNP